MTGAHFGPALMDRSDTFLAKARRQVRHLTVPVMLMTPALVILIVLRLIPIVNAIRLSFTSWDGFSSPKWIGTANYAQLIHDAHFKAALLHNLEILIVLPIWVFLPYAVAWILQRRIWGWRFFRFAFFLPAALSPAVIGVYYSIVLDNGGPFNTMLRTIGLGGLARPWLNDPSSALPIVIAIIVWSTFGLGVVIFLGAFPNIDHEQIDAAKVDGATGWQIQRYVVFWQLLPVFEFWSIIIMIASFTAFFPLIYSLTDGGPGFSTYTVDFDLYTEAFSNGNLGYAAAIGVTLLLVMVIIGVAQLLLLRGRRA